MKGIEEMERDTRFIVVQSNDLRLLPNLPPQSKDGVNSFGGLGATPIDSLDTLFIMGLDEQFQKAKEWVATSLDFNKNYDASVFETTIRLHLLMVTLNYNPN
ncbi:hypothetical protein Syun_019380 [Stephania yunnanensis]|uniref:alpha-1,2-Mannosidase n=1 Tax=Stephania yunnanensis TaxID=152371 RepID=A0AAP0NWM9_9MAGN